MISKPKIKTFVDQLDATKNIEMINNLLSLPAIVLVKSFVAPNALNLAEL